MSQDYRVDYSGKAADLVITNYLPASLEALRSMFVGASAPSSPIAGQHWIDTTNAVEKVWNGSAWVVCGPAYANAGHLCIPLQFGAVTASVTRRILCQPTRLVIEKLVLVSDTATTGSSAGATEWTAMLRNESAGVDLFSAAPGTGTNVSGVGGGVELAVDTAFVLTPNQNATTQANDVLTLEIAKVGSPTNLGDLAAFLHCYMRGN